MSETILCRSKLHLHSIKTYGKMLSKVFSFLGSDDCGTLKKLTVGARRTNFAYSLLIFCLFFRTIRAPVPWHDSYKKAKDFTIKYAFTTNPVMMEIQNVWTNRYIVFIKYLSSRELAFISKHFPSKL